MPFILIDVIKDFFGICINIDGSFIVIGFTYFNRFSFHKVKL